MRQFSFLAFILTIFLIFTFPYWQGLYYDFRVKGEAPWVATFVHDEGMFNTEQVSRLKFHFTSRNTLVYTVKLTTKFDRVSVTEFGQSHSKGMNEWENTFEGKYYFKGNVLFVAFNQARTMRSDFDVFQIEDVVSNDDGTFMVTVRVPVKMQDDHLVLMAANAGQEVHFDRSDKGVTNDFMLYRHQYEPEQYAPPEPPVQKSPKNIIGDPQYQEDIDVVVDEMVGNVNKLLGPDAQISSDDVDQEQLMNTLADVFDEYAETRQASEAPRSILNNKIKLDDSPPTPVQEPPQYVPYHPDTR